MSSMPQFGAGLWHFASYLDRYATDGYADPLSTLEQIAKAGAVGDLSFVDVPYPYTEGVTTDDVAAALKEHGAKRVLAYCVHPVLSGAAISRINDSALDELVVTDTIPLSEEAQKSPRIRQLSVADVLAETIRRISNEDSVSSLFIE